MIEKLPYPVYVALVKLGMWRIGVWCALKDHQLYVSVRHPAGYGYGCAKCDWWRSSAI